MTKQIKVGSSQQCNWFLALELLQHEGIDFIATPTYRVCSRNSRTKRFHKEPESSCSLTGLPDSRTEGNLPDSGDRSSGERLLIQLVIVVISFSLSLPPIGIAGSFWCVIS